MSSALNDKLQELDIPLPPEEVTINKVVRWGHNGRYWAVKLSGGEGYILGDWVSGLKEFAFEKGFNHQKYKQQIKEAQQKLIEKRNDKNIKAAAFALKMWNAADNCLEHPYLENKKIKSHGLKIDRQTLLIPLYDEDGNLSSLQKIWETPAGPKKFIKGFIRDSRVQGSFFILGLIKNELVICEGYATGATIHEITGLPVVVAFSSNNLLAVAKIIRKKYPRAKIIIAADNDQRAVGSDNINACAAHTNPGLTKAKKAAAAVNARLVVPGFASDSNSNGKCAIAGANHIGNQRKKRAAAKRNCNNRRIHPGELQTH